MVYTTQAVVCSSWKEWCKTFTIDPSSDIYYRWLVVISLAVVYNLIVVIARSIFWKLHDQYIW